MGFIDSAGHADPFHKAEKFNARSMRRHPCRRIDRNSLGANVNGELAQCVMLTSYGNAYLHDARRVSREVVDHVAFQHTKTIQFGLARPFDGVTAFRKWVQSLKRGNVVRLWLTDSLAASGDLQAHNAEAFSNANPRGIIAEYPEANNGLWVPHWKFTRGSKWLVAYNCYQAPALPQSEDLAAITRRLTKAIKSAKQFASGSFQNWVDWFQRALDAIELGRDSVQWFPSFGYSALCRQLMAGAASAWVFGGMGSWNDLWFEDKSHQNVYTTVTEELYSAVCTAIVASTNAFDSKEEGT